MGPKTFDGPPWIGYSRLMAGFVESLSLSAVILTQATGIGARFRVKICAEEGDCVCSRMAGAREENGRNVVKAAELRAKRDAECSDLVGSKDLAQAELDGANLQAAGLSAARLRGARLAGANLSHAHLEEAHLEGARASNADFDGAQLDWTTFDEDSQLVGGRFLFASLQNAVLNGADLRWSCLRGASLTGAHLRGADLRGAVLEAYTLRWADLAGAVFDRNTKWPQEITPEIAVAKLHMIRSAEAAAPIDNPPCR